MNRIARAPPVTGLALATGAGATLVHLGVPLSWTLAPLPIILLLDPPWKRPGLGGRVRILPLVLALLAGAVLTRSWRTEQSEDCRFRLPEGLEVEAVGDAGPTGTIFAIGRSNGSKPMLELDFNAPGIDAAGNFTIPDAILLTQLLNELGDRIEPSCNVKMSAGLKVSAFVENHAIELASGKVGIDWPDVFDDTCII